MANTSELLALLSAVPIEDLRRIASYRGLSTAGSSAILARRVCDAYGDDLDEVVSPGGPLPRDKWNDLLERELGGERRRSFEELREEIRARLSGQGPAAPEDVLAQLTREPSSVGDVRRDDALAGRIAVLLETSVAKLRAYLTPQHGRTGITRLAPELVQRFAPHAHTGAVSERGSVAVVSSPSSAASSAPVVAPLTNAIVAPKVGSVLGGRWTIIEELGRGGMGTAFSVRHRRGRICVAKVAHGDGNETARLVREGEIGLTLAHENVCRFYELEDDPTFGVFVVMQHCGSSLEHRFKRTAADVSDAMEFLSSAAKGIDYLHGKGIVHGDVSPANLLVDDTGQVRVADLGIASEMRAVTKTDGVTHVGELHGRNRAFAADEVLRGQPPRRGSDQASLAKVFCALLVGVERYHREPKMSFKRLGPRQAALDLALHADPGRRHPTCEGFVRALMGDMT